jgi:peptide/nickel transport system permease protein
MQVYILRRLLLMIPTIFILGTSLFFLLRVLPGDLAVGLLTSEESSATAEEIEELREYLGLNDHILVQYGRWLKTIGSGDLGYSPLFDSSVVSILWSKLGITIELAIIAVVISLVWAIPLGVISALRRGSWIDQAIRVVTAAGISLPNFWVALMVLLVLVAFFRWSPPVQYVHFLDNPIENLKMLFLPALVIGFRSAAVITRMTRSMMLEVIGQDYVRTARAKGLSGRTVTLRHALPNASLPILTLAALLLAALVDGAVIIEVIFNLPGLGQLIRESITRRDYELIQGIVLVLALFMMVWILITDLLYAWLDPRIRYS